MKKNKSSAGVIMRRELSSYFTSPVAYIVGALFLIFAGFLFFTTFFLVKRAELRQFFALLPVLFSFFIPAITMRSFSEETRSGSFETLLTLPVTPGEIVAGKFGAAFIFSAVMLVPSLLYLLTVTLFGSPDIGPVFCGYLGALLLAAAFTAVGIFASSITKNQIVAFFAAFTVSILLSMIDQFLIFMPAVVVDFLHFISAGNHFSSISRGIIDSRDVIYFLSVTVLFCGLTLKAVEKRRTA